jgi:hypothetical protein
MRCRDEFAKSGESAFVALALSDMELPGWHSDFR